MDHALYHATDNCSGVLLCLRINVQCTVWMIVGLVLIMRLAIHMLRITCYIMGMLTTINKLPLKLRLQNQSYCRTLFHLRFPFWVHSHSGIGHHCLLQQYYAQVESRGQRGQL